MDRGTLENTFAACEVVQWIVVQLLPKPQMSECRFSTICTDVERPDHHCDDDLAYLRPLPLQTRISCSSVVDTANTLCSIRKVVQASDNLMPCHLKYCLGPPLL